MATITKESIGNLHEKISVKLNKEDYLPAFEKSLKEYSKKANIPGFRPGKVPTGMIKKMYGPSLFMDEVLKSVDRELIHYLDENKVDIFAQPLPLDTDMAKLDANNPGDYNFDFEIGLKPEFDLPDLGKAPITAFNIDITNDMVNSEIERIQNRYGNMNEKIEVDGEENVINVLFTETDADGNEIENGVKKDNSLLVKYFKEPVRKDLFGKKAEDSINIKLGEAFDDKELEFIAQDLGFTKEDESVKDKTFKVTITKVGELEKRKLDSEFFMQLFPEGDVTTEEDFRKKIHDSVFNQWANESRNQIHDQIFHNLTDNAKIDFPETFLRKWLVTQSAQPNPETGAPAKTEAQIDEEMPTFLNQLKWTLISDKIVKDNNVTVTPDELKDFAKQQLMGYMGGNIADIDEQPWVSDYLDKIMKDRKFVEDAYGRIQSQKVFEWAEKQVKPTSQQVTADEFTKMVSMHHHH